MDLPKDDLSRVMSIKWGYDISQMEHFVQLVREFLENSRQMSVKLGREKPHPFFDLCEEAGVPSELPAEVVEKYEFWAVQQPVSRLVLIVCLWYLKACQAAPDLATLGLDGRSFYEPLMRIFDEGGSFRIENGCIAVGHGLISMK